MIYCQEKVLSTIDKFDLDTLPRTVLLEGQKGSGRHMIINHVARKFNLIINDITDNLTLDTINDIMLSTEPRLYLIDTSKITEKQENIILKFLEEPLKNSYVFLISLTSTKLLDTIYNRCFKLVLHNYSQEELKQFIPITVTNPDLLLALAKTPGDIQLLQSYDLNNMFNLADKIINQIYRANYGNILKLSNSVAFKDEKDKYDVDIFFRLIEYISYKLVVDNKDYIYMNIYNLVNEYLNRFSIKNIDKKYVFERFLFELKELTSDKLRI